MGRPLRNTDPKNIHLISARTFQQTLLMTPDDKVNRIIGGILAKYQEEFGIIIFAYVVEGNHYHLLAQAPNNNLWVFMCAINREIAKRMNNYRNRHGHFFERRYDDLLTIEPADNLEALAYIATNPSHHGLVENSKDWPGLTCYNQLFDEKSRSHTFTNYTDYQKARQKARRTKHRVDIRDFETKHQLTLTRLPQFEKLSKQDYISALQDKIDQYIKIIKEERQKQKKGYLGRKAIRTQNPFAQPKEVSKSPRPLCYTKNPLAKKSFMETYFPWVKKYLEASKKFRSGLYDTMFPEFSIKPPMHYVVCAQT